MERGVWLYPSGALTRLGGRGGWRARRVLRRRASPRRERMWKQVERLWVSVVSGVRKREAAQEPEQEAEEDA
jgi:hypothetical protein